MYRGIILHQASVTIYPTEPTTSRIGRNASSSSELEIVVKKQTEKSKVGDLPHFYNADASWTTAFLPAYIKRLGESSNPWSQKNILQTIQEVRDEVYSTSSHTVDKKSAVYSLVSISHSLILFKSVNPVQAQDCASDWRHDFGHEALQVVGIALSNKYNFPTAQSIEERVAYLVGDDCPFLWANGFEPVAEGEVIISDQNSARKYSCMLLGLGEVGLLPVNICSGHVRASFLWCKGHQHESDRLGNGASWRSRACCYGCKRPLIIFLT